MMSPAQGWGAACLALAFSSAASEAQGQQAELRPWPRPQRATNPGAERAGLDRFEFRAESQTYLRLFRRALLPGPSGALVTTETASPLTEYLSARARDVDSPWHEDSLALEFAAWGQLWPTSSDYERPFDGDVQTASLRYRLGHGWLRLGRQVAAGGAARFSRFDGAAVGYELPSGLSLMAYAGALVLPRWNERIGYHQLGRAERELLQGAPLELDRAAHWLAGGRVGYGSERLRGALSVHEQREQNGLARRNLGLDLSGTLLDDVAYGGSALAELDAKRLADARVWLEVAPHPLVHVSLDALRTEPSSFLSRQSVLSVFSTDGYAEFGGTLELRARPWLMLEGAGYGLAYDTGRPGARAEGSARLELSRFYEAFVRLSYSRVVLGESGYHALRNSLAGMFSSELRGTLELYGFVYDQPVQGFRTSSVCSGTLDYRASKQLALLWGASVASTPYAKLDAQTLVRVSYAVDTLGGGSSFP